MPFFQKQSKTTRSGAFQTLCQKITTTRTNILKSVEIFHIFEMSEVGPIKDGTQCLSIQGRNSIPTSSSIQERPRG